MFKIIVSSALVAAARAHMIMSSPMPYDSPAVSHSPLNPDGSNFPCQLAPGASLVSGSASNTFALGSQQELAFIGQATHGGGSCQISLTYDKNPSPSSVWKVITSIEGGCPARGESGNMGDDASAADPYTYTFTVPTDIPTGDVTLAWTWFNKIGNREMYMNCAPVTLTGSSGSSSNYDALPDMFVANIGNGCGTVDSTDLLFPNPGIEVQSLNGATSAFAAPTGACAAGSGSGPGTSPATSPATSPTATPSTPSTPSTKASSPVATGYPTATPKGNGPSRGAGGVFITVSTSAAATEAAETVAAVTVGTTPAAETVATTSATAPATTSTSAAAVAAPTGTGTASSSTGSVQTPGSPCSPDGTWNCMGSSFQRCASGVWSVVEQMAAGTTCALSAGGASIDIVATSSKHRRAAGRMARRMASRIPNRRQ